MSWPLATGMQGGVKSGQDTTAAAIVSSPTACFGVLVQNDPDNTVDILVGGAAAQPIQLSPGSAQWFGVNDAALVYTKSISGTANVNYLYLTK